MDVRSAVAGLLVLLVVAVRDAGAQPLTIPATELASPIPETRMKAFFELVRGAGGMTEAGTSLEPLVARAKAQDELALALIALLEREVAIVVGSAPASLNGDYLETYYPDLSTTVASLRDPRALPSLMHVMHLGNRFLDAVVDMGEPAIAPLLATIARGELPERSAAARALGHIMKRRNQTGVTDSTATLVRAALINAVRDPDRYILRLNAAEALGAFDGPDVRAEMERLATSDTYSVQRGPAGTPRRFPVREVAQAWLARAR